MTNGLRAKGRLLGWMLVVGSLLDIGKLPLWLYPVNFVIGALLILG